MFAVGVVLFLIAAIAGLVYTIRKTKKAGRIAIIAINCLVIIAIGVIWVIAYYDNSKEEEESYEYVIHEGDEDATITYAGNINGYECVKFSTLESSDIYAVPADKVRVASFCKGYKYVKVYSARNTSLISGGDESIIDIGNGEKAYLAESTRMIKPDYENLVLFSIVFGVIFIGIVDMICGFVFFMKRPKVY